MNKLKALKIIVSFLSFFLVLGMLFAITVVYKKTSSPKNLNLNQNLNQPSGSIISDFKITEDGKIYLLIKKAGHSDKIIITNPLKPEFQPIQINLN